MANCEKCGGPIWDNTFSKRNPKQPDLKCKNQEGCGWVKWLTDAEKNAQRATNGAAPSVNGTRPAGGLILDAMMYRCIESAQKIAGALFKDGNVSGLSADLVLNMATTIYISRVRGEGILKMEKPAQQAPPPPPPPAPEPEYASVGGDDLPF